MLVITFDIDDTLIASSPEQERHCMRMRLLFRALRQTPGVLLFVMSGRLERDRDLTLQHLREVRCWVPSGQLLLKEDARISDAEHKSRTAANLPADIVIDNSDACRGEVLESGTTYLLVPEAARDYEPNHMTVEAR